MSTIEVIQLSPQEMVITNRDLIVSTLLGSCVAVCLHDDDSTGAMCHAMLPFFVGDSRSVSPRERLKYVDTALDMMLERFSRRGIAASTLRASLFGGANMFDVDRKGLLDVGRKNIDAARTVLEQRKIRISKMDIGGNQGRKVAFNPRTGETKLYLVPVDGLRSGEVRV